MGQTKVKICGITTEDTLKAAVDGGADFVGMVFFAKSPRNISFVDAGKLLEKVPNITQKVAVLVNPTDQFLEELSSFVRLDYFQLHGDETPERVHEIKERFSVKIIKAFAIQSKQDVSLARNYAEVADMFMFDAKVKHSDYSGGMGISFDWALLHGIKFNKPWFLSGGLDKNNVEHALSVTKAEFVDISSGVEISKGVKDPQMILDFLNVVKSYEHKKNQ